MRSSIENLVTTHEVMAAWNQSLADVVSNGFGDGALQDLIAALEALARGSSSSIIVYPAGKKPYVACHRLLPEEDPQLHLDQYIAGAYLVDPYYVHALEAGVEGFFSIKELAPEGFEYSEYYRIYYHAVGMLDEACFLFRDQADGWIIISLARHSEDMEFSADDRAQLDTLFPLMKAIVGRCLQGSQHDAPAQELETHLDAALENFGTSLLTRRESLILSLLLRGHSIKSIAQRLENSLETIKHHRKNIYAKLDVSTQAELFHLFIDSLRSSTLEPDKDPLIAYMSV